MVDLLPPADSSNSAERNAQVTRGLDSDESTDGQETMAQSSADSIVFAESLANLHVAKTVTEKLVAEVRGDERTFLSHVF